jgi:surfactin synthase thioesterase subunit
VRQGKEEQYRPELYVAPEAGSQARVFKALERRVERLQEDWPGLALEAGGAVARIAIPERYRVGHEPHFAQVLAQFLKYFHAPESIPVWEQSNMLAKYCVSTAASKAR